MTDALFVDGSPSGIYPTLLGAEHCWDEKRDARTYAGPGPVVAHPPCNLWVNMAAVNYTRAVAPCEACDGTGTDFCHGGPFECGVCNGTGRREPNRAIVLPAWYPGGTDEGCFAAADEYVTNYGGVLEHPAGSHAWDKDMLPKPTGIGWTEWHYDRGSIWVCEVWQSAYGHAARKRTWLIYAGRTAPFGLRWEREEGTHQIGWFDRNKPTLSKKAASATPATFAMTLIELARWSRG